MKLKPKPKLRPKGPQKPVEGAVDDGLGQVPIGALNVDRAGFYGHTLLMLEQSGVRWVRVRADWSITVGRWDGTRGSIPAVVACTRDRLHAQQYVTAVYLGRPTDGIAIELDEYDRDLSAAVKVWRR
jgi:hypothetical protein